jgi:hypothetical protein
MLICFPCRSEPLCGKRASRLRKVFTASNASNPFSRSISPGKSWTCRGFRSLTAKGHHPFPRWLQRCEVSGVLAGPVGERHPGAILDPGQWARAPLRADQFLGRAFAECSLFSTSSTARSTCTQTSGNPWTCQCTNADFDDQHLPGTGRRVLPGMLGAILHVLPHVPVRAVLACPRGTSPCVRGAAS